MVLVLAAGRAQRFGADKRMVLLYQAQTLLQRSVRSAADAGLDVVVCLSSRSADDVVARSVGELPARILRCRRAEEGMGATLAEGISFCDAYAGAFVALADMPFLRSSTYAELEAVQAAGRIVVPVHEGRRGHPVLFDAAFFRELRELSGDRGGSSLLQRHAGRCIEREVDDPGIHRDIDEPGDLPDG